MNQAEMEKQIPVMWQRVDEAQKRSIEAKALAEYLNRNVIEAVLLSQQAMKKANEVMEEQLKFRAMLEKQFYKNIGIITALLTVMTAILKLV